MKTAQMPENEDLRIQSLHDYSILDTSEEEDFDNLTKLATHICDTPISLVSLVDEDRQWFKSRVGINAKETPRDFAFCAHAILQKNELFEVCDATTDERFHDNPLVVSQPNVVFYAGFPLVDEAGYPLGTLCVIDHEPRKLNDQQKEALKALSKQVMNLIHLRRHRKLLKEQNEIISLRNKSLERFAYDAAHDLKSPLQSLQSISTAIQNSQKELLDEEGVELLEMMSNSAQKMSKLVNGILEMSRNTSVDILQKQEVVVSELFESIKSMFLHVPECKWKLRTNVDSITINPIAIQQIMLNLATNSIKYNDKPIPEITIIFEETESNLTFGVLDNGPGIPHEIKDKMFDLFQVGHSKDRFGHRGTGIGLATISSLSERLNASIHVDTEVGKGTMITLTVPQIS